MKIRELIWFLAHMPMYLWPTIWDMYWHRTDEGAAEMLKHHFPVGPPFWRWVLHQTLLIWLVTFGMWYFFGLPLAVVTLLAITGCAASIERNNSLLDTDRRLRIVGLAGKMAGFYMMLPAIGLLLLYAILHLDLPAEAVGYLVGKLVLTTLLIICLPILFHLHVKKSFEDGWRTRVWDYTGDGDSEDKENHLPAGVYRPRWSNDDTCERSAVSER